MTFSSFRMPDSEQRDQRDSFAERLDIDDVESEMMETQRVSEEEDRSRCSQEPFHFSKPQVFRNTGHRLYYNGVARQLETKEKLQLQRERTLVEEAQLAQRPAITEKAMRKPSKGIFYADHSDMWSKQRDANIEHIRRAVIERELHVCPGTPFINDKSIDIVESNPDYKHPVDGWHERFTQYIAKKHVSNHNPSLTFTPNINSNSVRRDGDVSIGDRLYDENERRKDKYRKLCAAEWARRLKDPHTGQPLFYPLTQNLNTHSQDQTQEEMFERLHDNAHERTVKLARRQEQKVAQDSNLTFTPVLSKTSQVLATQIERAPLYYIKQRGKSVNDASMSRSMSERNLIAPGQEGDFYLRSQHLERDRLKRLEKIQREKDMREREECTFQPRITENSKNLFMSQLLGNSRSLSQGHPEQAQLLPFHLHESPMQLSRRPLIQHNHHQQPQYSHPRYDAAADSRSELSRTTPMAAEGGHQFRTPKTSRQATPVAEDFPQSGQPMHVASQVIKNITGPQAVDDVGAIEGYVADFQQQMQGVLSEWKKLEEES